MTGWCWRCRRIIARNPTSLPDDCDAPYNYVCLQARDLNNIATVRLHEFRLPFGLKWNSQLVISGEGCTSYPVTICLMLCRFHLLIIVSTAAQSNLEQNEGPLRGEKCREITFIEFATVPEDMSKCIKFVIQFALKKNRWIARKRKCIGTTPAISSN